MKISTLIIMVSLLAANWCNAQQKVKLTDNESVLDFYKQYSEFTDPGEYAYLYESLPDSLPELCKLIRAQFIHSYAQLPKYRDLIPKERWNEAAEYPTVKSILEGLVSYDSSGLTMNRKPEDRLVLTCRHNSILLASILKHRGIPARVRYGHATYLIPNFHTSHVVCEVWNYYEKRWMLVDPSMNMIDFDREQFDISNDAWLQMQNGEIDPSQFGVPRRYNGAGSIVAKLCADMASILGTEYTIYQYPPLLDFAFEEDKKLTKQQVETLNKISELMKTLNAKNLMKLQSIFNKTPEIHFTKSLLNKTLPVNSDDKKMDTGNQ